MDWLEGLAGGVDILGLSRPLKLDLEELAQCRKEKMAAKAGQMVSILLGDPEGVLGLMAAVVLEVLVVAGMGCRRLFQELLLIMRVAAVVAKMGGCHQRMLVWGG
jgi:hypothetical protein